MKDIVNAGKHGKIIPIGSGTTGALKKLMEIIGVSIPPATQERIIHSLQELGPSYDEIWKKIKEIRPVVFISFYEHHTNELMWREAFCEVVKIDFDAQGMLDLNDLAQKTSAPKYENRLKIGSFSAGSNITGIRTKVYDVAHICHKHDTLVFFDFAAVAPYIKIDMNKDNLSYFDAIFFSPHKFLGGPGSSGVLIFNEKIYRTDLPPTTPGGGTVTYVGFSSQDYSTDIETREKAGTPPILQALRAAFAMDLKEMIGVETIKKRESKLMSYFIGKLNKIQNIQIVGALSSKNRSSIVSFNIEHDDRILHPKFVTKLMSDLFGIQSRAGCSCAGPYGHVLLGISEETSQKFRKLILKGMEVIKPGWVRINIHYTLSQKDVDYLINALDFIANSGHLFLRKYTVNMKTGEWKHRECKEKISDFSYRSCFSSKEVDFSQIEKMREQYLYQAKIAASELQKEKGPGFVKDEREFEELKYFYYVYSVQEKAY
jgi:selenocysteine lyase/cysteine desulfurase